MISKQFQNDPKVIPNQSQIDPKRISNQSQNHFKRFFNTHFSRFWTPQADFWTPTWGPKSEPRMWFLPSESLLLALGAVLEAPRAQDAFRQGSKGDFGKLLEGKITILGVICYVFFFIVKLLFLMLLF